MAAMGPTAVQTENGVEYLIRLVTMNVNDAESTAPRPRSNVMSFVVHQTPAGWRRPGK